MITDDVMEALRALSGLTRAAYWQGMAQIDWDGLCALCEDAVVATRLGDWDLNPHEAQSLVEDLGTRLAVYVARHDRQRNYAGRARQDLHGLHFSTVSILCTLDALSAADVNGWTALAAA